MKKKHINTRIEIELNNGVKIEFISTVPVRAILDEGFTDPRDDKSGFIQPEEIKHIRFWGE